jgi:hypothetical protein
MLVQNQKTKVKITKANKEWYEQKGYTNICKGEMILINTDDLTLGSHAVVREQCDYCGKIVDVVWKDYVSHNNGEYACKSCRLKKASETTLRQRQNSLYSRALVFCKSKGYELLTPKENIQNSNTYVKYNCPRHGEHTAKIYALVLSHGCAECQYEENTLKSRHPADYVESVFNNYGVILLNKEEYSKWDLKNLRAICPECGKEFLTSFGAFTKYCGQSCPACSASESRGEREIRHILENSYINFEQEYSFVDCRDKNPLPFDFYLPDYNVLIEYQGVQHYDVIERFGGLEGFILRQKHDQIKSEYCLLHNITLITIPYWEFHNITQILQQELNLHEDIV